MLFRSILQTLSLKLFLFMLAYLERLKGMLTALVYSMHRVYRYDWQSNFYYILLRTNPRAPFIHSITLLLFHNILDRSTQTYNTLSSPCESCTLYSFKKWYEQLVGTIVQNQCPMTCWNDFFCHPLKIQLFKNCLEYSFLVPMSIISFGYTIIARSISTLGSYDTQVFLRGKTKAFSQCSLLNYRSSVRWFSQTSNQLSFGGSIMSKNLARAKEQVKLGIRQILVFLDPMQLLKYCTKSMRNQYCLLEMALKSMQSRQAVGSLRLIFNKNLLYQSAVLKHPFLPKMSMNLKRDMKKLVDVALYIIYFCIKSSFKNYPNQYPPAISYMYITLWIRPSASRQLP